MPDVRPPSQSAAPPATLHQYHLEDLSPDDFERLVYTLVERSGEFQHVEWYGGSGDKGRDVVAYRRGPDGRETWYIQCKRYQNITFATLRDELEKVHGHIQSEPSFAPDTIVFATACNVSPQAKDAAIALARDLGLPHPYFWGRLELDARLKTQPETVRDFFHPGSTPPTALHQLPAPPADFTGREDKLTKLQTAIIDGGKTTCAIRGIGGVGKTALALVLAERLCPRYPDAQIYLDLQGTTRQPLNPVDAMAHVIRAFQPQAPLPDSHAELAAAYRSLLHAKRVLLLMDNAADRAQVEPLIPPAGCALLVTSRRRFTLPGLHSVNLDALPPADARLLLLRICERIGTAAGDLARLCGCLPLALRVAGSALAEREDLPVDVYLDRLRRGRQRFEEVDASLNLSYELLTDHLQRLWRLLAVFPGTFDHPAAVAVWDIDPDGAHDALSELVRYSLVEWHAENERYRLHDLARAFALARQTRDEGQQASRRHAAHYAQILGAADHLYLEGGDAPVAGLHLFDLEWPNVELGQQWAAAHLREDQQAVSLWSAYTGYVHCLHLRLRPAERIPWFESAAQACRQLGDRRGEGNALGNLGNAYSDLGQVERSVEHYQQALAIAREIGHRRGEGNHLGNLGNAYCALGQVERAIEHYEQALAIAREIGDRRGEGNHLGSLGNAYFSLGQAHRAIEHYQQALAIAREIGDRRGEGTSLGNLGNAHYALGQVECATEHYEQALAIAREIGDRSGEGNYLGSLGSVYRALGQVKRAIEHSQQALAIAREIGDRRGESTSLANLGLAHFFLGQVERAIEYHQQALAIARDIGDRRAEANRLGSLGDAYRTLGHVAKAIEHYEQALAIVRDIGDRRGEGSHLGSLGNAYFSLGRVERAIEHYHQALAIAREIGDRRGEGNHLGSLGNAYRALGQVERAIEHHEQALVIAREIGDRRGEGNHLGNLANAYYALGQVECAIEHYHQALAIAREIGDRPGEGTDLGNLGSVYRALGQVERAIEYHEQALVIAREIGDRRTEGNHLGNLATTYFSLGEVGRALEHCEQALAIAREIGDRRGEAFRSWNLALAYEDTDPARAIELMQVCVDYERSIGHPDAETHAARVAAIRQRITDDNPQPD